ncbi:hypothetical protein [Aeromicrobium chenweiae]|uniref:Uncharacterized protein n=1 Tax=Aeromicrobium chenweiae TaxID=2079793 RepID=A0A2S0WMC0_9ACTN|nr:hypothetical protein [Aeromicrobium chenweiae]AWB92457.1 hypothetical protein C3E78_09720 [Aeromicrobium chenweiae]TGN31253.1 hypothetical protein E4L97_12850 [Aeromicrobium chenweiae]
MIAPALADALRPLGGPVRLARSLAAALTCVVAAATGHLTAGGTMPAASVAAVFVAAATVAWLLSARRVTPGQLVGLLTLCQVGVHLSGSTGDMVMSAPMVAGHVAAVAVSALLLARGETLVWRLAERLALRGHASIVVVGPPHAAVPRPLVAPRALHDVRLAHSRSVRGPPTGSS